MGGAVRRLGCLTPDVWAVACPMHDDAFGELPGIDLPAAAGYALVGAAALPASFGLRPGRGARGRWALPALGQASSLLVLLVPVLSVTGAALVALGRDDTPGLLTAAAVRASHRWNRRALPATLAGVTALLAVGAGAVLASRAGTVVLAESAFALVLALLGMVLAWRAGVSGVHGSRGSQSARSPVASA